MIATKKHFNEYKDTFKKDATKIYNNLDEAAEEFAEKVNVSKEVAKDRIENNSNADWVIAPNGKVYMFYDFGIIKRA